MMEESVQIPDPDPVHSDSPSTSSMAPTRLVSETVHIDGYPVDVSIAAQLCEFPLRTLSAGERFRRIIGHATPTPRIKYGTVVRQGYDRYKDQYRVLYDGDSADQWEDRC